jgi:MFS family permease
MFGVRYLFISHEFWLFLTGLVSFCTFGFGLILILQGLVESWKTLMVTRWFLGMFETGMLPGCMSSPSHYSPTDSLLT